MATPLPPGPALPSAGGRPRGTRAEGELGPGHSGFSCKEGAERRYPPGAGTAPSPLRGSAARRAGALCCWPREDGRAVLHGQRSAETKASVRVRGLCRGFLQYFISLGCVQAAELHFGMPKINACFQVSAESRPGQVLSNHCKLHKSQKLSTSIASH